MNSAERIVDAFVSANILIIVAFGLWSLVRFGLRHLGLRHAHATQLRLLNAVFLAILCSPFLVALFSYLKQSGVGTGVTLNLSDIVVSYYLSGGIQMDATRFEQLLQIRHSFITDLINGAGWFANSVIALFLAGFVLGSIRLGYSVTCLFRIVWSSYHWRQFGRVSLRLSDRTLVPFSTRGLWRYYVVLPSHMLTDSNAMKVSVAHELQHIRQGDLEWEIILEALKPVFFLNPAFHAWKTRVEELRELSCDGAVLARGRINARRYCDTLLSVCQATLRRDRAFVIAVPKVTLVTADRNTLRDGTLGTLERRIMSLLEARSLRRPKLVFLSLLIPMVLSVSLAAIAIEKPADWSQDRLTLSTVVNLERLEEINRLSTFGRVRN